MSRKGNCWDDAPTESWEKNLEYEAHGVALKRVDGRN